jgi:hypothetical protein
VPPVPRPAASTSTWLGWVRDGWPVELDGGPRCQFCRGPDPAWVCDGPDVEVSLEAEPVLGIDHQVRGVEPHGRIDWAACEPCRALIDAGDYPGLLRRYGKRLPPMPVQAAWQAFWRDHGVAWPLEQTEQP